LRGTTEALPERGDLNIAAWREGDFFSAAKRRSILARLISEGGAEVVVVLLFHRIEATRYRLGGPNLTAVKTRYIIGRAVVGSVTGLFGNIFTNGVEALTASVPSSPCRLAQFRRQR
jgi:hypothetical protein